MKKKGLKTRDVVKVLLDYQMEHGYAPSYREMADSLGIKSVSTVSNWLNKLYRNNLIVSDTMDGSPRSFRLYAEWQENLNIVGNATYICSLCGDSNNADTRFCPHCGALMENGR